MFKVIVAEDEEIIRNGIAGLVSSDPRFDVVAKAADGLEAMSGAELHRPDILLVDINMPKMNGLELAEALSSVDWDPLIILITGYSDFEYARKALRLGVFDYFLKPIMEDQLFDALSKACEHLEERKAASEMSNQFMEAGDFVLEGCLNQLEGGEIDKASAVRQLSFLNSHLNDSAFIYKVCCSRSSSVNDLISELDSLLSGRNLYLRFINSMNQAVFLCDDCSELLEDKASGFSSYSFSSAPAFGVDLLVEGYLGLLENQRPEEHLSPQLSVAIDFISDNYMNPLFSLGNICDACNLSSGYLGRLFKKELQQSPIEYLTKHRIYRAGILLSTTDLRIYEIAERTGFSSQHYFSNTFRRYNGKSPKDYRRQVAQL